MDSFIRPVQDSCHICPNSFRVGISQLTSTLKMLGEGIVNVSISSFTIKSGTVCYFLTFADDEFIFTLSTSMKAAWENLQFHLSPKISMATFQ